jgi:hypothetical protein
METKSPLLIFLERFGTKEACYQLIYNYKWKAGYRCKRCGCTNSIIGRTQFHKRCSACKYDESCTAHTLFHKLKFPVVKAFAIIFQLATLKKGMSSCEIARQYGIHQETAWFFQKKVQLAMLNIDQGKHVLNSEKIIRQLLYLINKKENKLVRDPQLPGDYFSYGKSQLSAKDSFSKGDSSRMKLEEKNHKNLSKLLSHTENRAERKLHFINLSFSGISKIFPVFKLFNLRNWLIGIHHKVSLQHLIKYLGEFLYRFTNRKLIEKLPLWLVNGFAEHERIPYASVIAL